MPADVSVLVLNIYVNWRFFLNILKYEFKFIYKQTNIVPLILPTYDKQHKTNADGHILSSLSNYDDV